MAGANIRLPTVPTRRANYQISYRVGQDRLVEGTAALDMQNRKSMTTAEISAGFVSVFERLRKSMPPSSCTIEFGTTGSDAIAIVKPTNVKAAEIDARLKLDFGVYLTLGKGTVFELPLKGKRYTNLPFFEELEAICKAVTLGKFEEGVSFVQDTVSSATGAVIIEGRKDMITDSWVKIGWNLFRKKRTVHLTYESYTAAFEASKK